VPITYGGISASRLTSRLGKASDELSRSYERLSSGLRINRASDDAAGLAVASSLQASTRVLGQAIQNVNDGISLLSIAEGALGEMQ
jgi:flagellin